MASSLPPLVPVPFAEAIAWAKARGVVLPDVYYGQLQGFARAKAFSVAGITKLDQLLLVHESLNNAIGTGQTFAEWKQVVLAQGAGLGDMPMHRLDNIFRTNIQSDYARGRCEQQRRNKERFPWLLYDAVNDSRTRPAHAAMDGFIARHDDPIWAKWRPPCGYRCRCRLISLTEKQAQRYIDADARRLGNDKPQDHLWGLTYAQARSRAISEGPDAGWDYDICQECGGSQLDHCSGATRGIEQATDDRLRALHEVAGTPGGQALADAVEPELIADLKETTKPRDLFGWDDTVREKLHAAHFADFENFEGYRPFDRLAQKETYKQLGYDALPTELSSADFDAMDSPGPVLWRAVAEPSQRDDFFTGDTHFPGLGIYGNGTYTVYGEGAEAVTRNYGESRWRMKLKPTARICDKSTYNSLVEKYDALLEKAKSDGMDEFTYFAYKEELKNPVYLLSREGYDGYYIHVGDPEEAPPYFVLLNRGAVYATR